MLFDFSTLSTKDRYKLMVSTIVPRPIAWIVSEAADGTLNAAPYSFFNAFSDDPPMIAIGIGGRPGGGLKDSSQNIRDAGEFVVNLVSEETARAMVVTGIDFAPEVDEIAEAGLTTTPSRFVRPPRIVESPVALECVRYDTVGLPNDRALVLGRVVAIHVRDDAVLDQARCYIDTPKLNLVGRMHGGGWYARTTDRFEIPRIPVAEWKKAAE